MGVRPGVHSPIVPSPACPFGSLGCTDNMLRMRSVVGNIGTILGIVGLLWTAFAFLMEHRQRKLGVLFPEVVTARQGSVALLRRLAGGRRDAVLAVGTARATSWTTGAAEVAIHWSNIEGRDDPEAGLMKLNANVNALRTWMEQGRHEDREFTRARLQALTNELGKLRAQISESEAADRLITTRAMRHQIGGLFLALVGAVLTGLANG
jgi:hypothetical protein